MLECYIPMLKADFHEANLFVRSEIFRRKKVKLFMIQIYDPTAAEVEFCLTLFGNTESFFFKYLLFFSSRALCTCSLKNFVAEVFIFSLHNETIKVSMAEAHSRCITVLLTGNDHIGCRKVC